MAGSSSACAAWSLYVHVPFCAQKCDYCAFYSAAADGALVNRYVAALAREIELRSASVATPPATIFFGGGTPSLLNLRQWSQVLDAIRAVGWDRPVEWTVECNPATVSRDKAGLLRDAGVNRVSMGVQSMDDTLLDRLGRVHTREMVLRSFETLRGAGFDNLNLDLMFAIPGQSLEQWRQTLEEVLRLGSEHLSCYEVIYEEDTPLFEQLRAGTVRVDEDLAAAMYESLVEYAAASGFEQYEVANWARSGRVGEATEGGRPEPGIPRFACRHNVNYWRGGTYMALGPSASGFEGGVRYRNVANTQAYCGLLEQGRLPREWHETLSPRSRAGEIAAFGLRMNAGWPWDAFQRATGWDLRDEWAGDMERLEARGWGIRECDRFRLTTAGLRFADAAGSEFLRAA